MPQILSRGTLLYDLALNFTTIKQNSSTNITTGSTLQTKYTIGTSVLKYSIQNRSLLDPLATHSCLIIALIATESKDGICISKYTLINRSDRCRRGTWDEDLLVRLYKERYTF